MVGNNSTGMLLLFSPTRNCDDDLEQTQDVAMQTVYALGHDVEYGGMMPEHINASQRSSIDAASKLGAPLKQTSTPKHQQSGSKSTQSSRQSSNVVDPGRYKTVLCDKFAVGHCPYGWKCHYAHGREELRRRPRHPKYKTELCRNFHTTGICLYGERCDFVHSKPNPESSEITTDQNKPSPIWSNQNTTPTMWPNQTMTNRSNHSPPWMIPSQYGQLYPTNMAPLTIPTSSDLMGVSQLYQAPSFSSGLGESVSSGSPSCVGSPQPSSSSDHSPVSFTPDSLTSFDQHAFFTAQQSSSPYITVPGINTNLTPHSTGLSEYRSIPNDAEEYETTGKTPDDLQQLCLDLWYCKIPSMDAGSKENTNSDSNFGKGESDEIFDRPLGNDCRRFPTYPPFPNDMDSWNGAHGTLEPALG